MGRFVKNPVLVEGSSTGGGNPLPIGTTSQRPASASAGTMRYNSTLNMLEFHNGTEYVQVRGAVSGQHTITTDTFTLDGSTTAFTMSLTPKHERNILVFMEGVFQKHSTYSISGATLTLTPSYPADNSKVVTVLHGFDFT
jgi:hypothetical protein